MIPTCINSATHCGKLTTLLRACRANLLLSGCRHHFAWVLNRADARLIQVVNVLRLELMPGIQKMRSMFEKF